MIAKPSKQSLPVWFDSPFGHYLLSSQRALLRRQLSDLGGYHLLQLGVLGEDRLEESFGHSHKFVVERELSGSEAAVADFKHLPLPSDTIDTALLHHALEFSANPHQVLSEVARVIAPGGHVILVVFNPLSSVGLLKLMAASRLKNEVWHHHSLRLSRVLDWLRLLGFQPLKYSRGCHQLPIQSESWLKCTNCFQRLDGKPAIYGGSYYVIVARKQVAPLTPTGKKYWRSLTLPAVEKIGCRKESLHRDKKKSLT